MYHYALLEMFGTVSAQFTPYNPWPGMGPILSQ
jgi:hypothetical protein